MKKYKVYDLLATLSPVEIRQIRKVLRSPFFVERDSLQQLFEIILKWQSKKKAPPSLEWLFQRLFPRQLFHDLKIRSLMSDLRKFVEEWLVLDHLRKDKIQSQLILSNIYHNRKLEKNFQSSIKKASLLIEDSPSRNQHYYAQLLELHEIKMNHDSAFKRTEPLYFQEISQNTDIHFLIRKLKNACSLLTHQSVYKAQYDFGLLGTFIEDLEKSAYLKIPAVAIFYYCFKFLKEKDSLAYFRLFKEKLTEYRDHFSHEDLKGLYFLGINFCIKKLNQSSKEFAQEGLELYKDGLDREFLMENNKITRFTFNNVVAMALFLEKYDWLQIFIESSSKKLESKYQKATISFNKARLAFARKNFGEALLHLQSAEYKDLVNNLISKLLITQIYYELNEIGTLESHLDSFQQFIRRREVSDYHRKNFLNIIGYIRKIINTPKYEKTKRKLIQAQITAEPVLSIRGWLLEKVSTRN